jgi:ATP-dependent Clp protease ATP-binding subunit ClpA
MLFAGPTGVGKTASARALAAYVYGAGQRSDPMVRLDMSEFQHPAQIGRLIGSGREPGKLVQLVRERPFSVVLLDEIEKAHPVFFDALMTVLDEGVLADAAGRTTDFRNTIVIMTTNLGARRGGSLGFGHEAPPSYEADIRAFFRPEFYNRIDQLVVFRPLSKPVVEEIARKELAEVAAREGFAKRKIRVDFTAALVRHIAETGFDPTYGARPLQRAIEQRVVGPVAKFLVAHRVTGALNVDWRDGVVAITRGQ